ncbi:MAG: 23S rRNA (guanosine(2251)-2'-O)-methyltransferase RlmB [Actinomycetales bacterium]
MAGNSQRRGAVRKAGSKKGQVVGSGGQKPKRLKGKGPTPKATERPKHPAARKAAAAARRNAATSTRSGGRGGGRGGSSRKGGGSEWVFGRNAVVEALRAGVPIMTMYVANRIDTDDRVREALKTAAAQGFPLLEVQRLELDRLSDDGVHQGLAIQVPAYEYAHPDDVLAAAAEHDEAALVVALDGVTDPRNLGAVVRSAGAFGAHGVVVPERRSAGMTAAAWKVSAGAAARVPVARVANLTRALESFKEAGCFVVGLDAGGELDLPLLDIVHEPLVLVVGSEGRGLSRLVRDTCDLVVSIPMSASTESLNAGVAAGVALYEVARRRAHH